MTMRQNEPSFIFPDTTSMDREEILKHEGLENINNPTNPFAVTSYTDQDFERHYQLQNDEKSGCSSPDHYYLVGCYKYCDEYCIIVFNDYASVENAEKEMQVYTDLFNLGIRQAKCDEFDLEIQLVKKLIFFPIVENRKEAS